ncbi:Geranylgeranyl transferase type-2 subunit alpha 1-like protein [Drosera capensis]
MHGRPRNPVKCEDEAVAAARASKLRDLQSRFLHNHHHNIYDAEAMEVSARLLEMNPEYYTVWNYRKMAVKRYLDRVGGDGDGDGDGGVEGVLKRELDVAQAALRVNFKSYGAWHHRKWVLNKCHSSLDKEMELINLFQRKDSRNFHAWNHRRFVAALMNSSEIDELKYTRDVIGQNFSNYSAWHNRSVILCSLFKKKAEGCFPKEKILNEEYQLVQNAIFTEPNDQSGWFYYLWLLDLTIDEETPSVIASWPAPGSERLIVTDGSAHGNVISPFGSYQVDTGFLPIVLYFSKPVKGVGLATITVKSFFTESVGLTWRPLSTSTDYSRAWVAYLDLSNVICGSSETYPVEVRCHHSQGITSFNGFHCSHDFISKFTVCIHVIDSSHANIHEMGAISWDNSNFQKHDGGIEESISLPVSQWSRMYKDKEAVASKYPGTILANEIALLHELLAVSDKIGKLLLAKLLAALDTVVLDNASSSHRMEEILELYRDLMARDTPHLQYYKDQHSITLLNKATSSGENLSRYCWHYTDISITASERVICLRFNNLALTQFTSIERLLWVEMLDLCHNELRSINGLEAMQSLSCLNLSNNKLRSFTALDPLRRLKFLKVLNISHNEIGGHSIDTTRYLWSSPLSHSVRMYSNCDDAFPVDDVTATKHWEGMLIFRDLKLTQLDIIGNPVVDEDFVVLLHRLLPKLVWLDGQRLNAI